MKEIKVYVDELPESCDKCPYHSKKLLFAENKDSIYKTDCRLGFAQNCNIKSIKTHDRELVRQVCEKIKEKAFGLWYFVLNEQQEHFEGNRYVLSQKDFNDILDQIQKEFEK